MAQTLLEEKKSESVVPYGNYTITLIIEHDISMHTVHTMINKLKLRVHIAPVGFEIDRIVIPAKKMRADKVWLIAHSNLSQDKARPFLEKIRKTLAKKNIQVKEVTADRFRLFDIVKTVKEIIFEEQNNDVYLNVASGSKIHAVGCMMACMIFDDRTNIHPYYAQAKEYPQYRGSEQQTFGVEDIHQLPTYQIRTPNPKLLSALALVKKKGKLTKKEFAEDATNLDLISVGARDENYEQARFASLDKNIIQPLENEWGFIKVEKIGRNRWIKLTKEGEYASEFLP